MSTPGQAAATNAKRLHVSVFPGLPDVWMAATHDRETAST
jgi:hypothetical protein